MIEKEISELCATVSARAPLWSISALAIAYSVLAFLLLLISEVGVIVEFARSLDPVTSFAGALMLICFCLVMRNRSEVVQFGPITLYHRKRGEIEFAFSPGGSFRQDLRTLLLAADRAADAHARNIRVIVRTRTFGADSLKRWGFRVSRPVVGMRVFLTLALCLIRPWWQIRAAWRRQTLPKFRMRPWIVGRGRLGPLLESSLCRLDGSVAAARPQLR